MSEEAPQTLVDHFLQSKKALAHGQNLCSHASELNDSTAATAVEGLAFEAKWRWMSEAVLEQLNLASSVSRSLSTQRTKLLEEARGWDSLRSERNQSLDAILENLGQQLVPPNLHLMSSGSSLFGSQLSLPEITAVVEEESSKSGKAGPSTGTDAKSKWKTLRDFVDEKGIEDALEQMEEDRNALDDVLASTASHPTTLNKHIADIKANILSPSAPPRPIGALLSDQDATATEMAQRLESLTAHYDQMSEALKDEEEGREMTSQDMSLVMKDTNQLPVILIELEAAVQAIEGINKQVVEFRDGAHEALESIGNVLLQLENLEATMDIMLEDHTSLQNDAAFIHQTLQTHYQALQELEEMYHSYQLAYDHLILEMDRRSRYREGMGSMIDEMSRQLNAFRNEELQARENFINLYGRFLPDDLCPYVPDQPLVYVVEREGTDGAVTLDDAVVAEAQRNLGIGEAELEA